MKAARWCLLIGSMLLPVGWAQAHGIPIYLSAENGRLKTDTHIYTSSMDFIPGFGYETDMPGISIASSASNISSGKQISFNVVDNLFYYDGTSIVPTAATLTVENALGQSVAVTHDTIFENGPLLGTYNGSTGWHEHGYFTLDLSAPVGAYGLVVTFTAPGLAYSEAVLLMFNRGLSTPQFNSAVSAVAATQFGKPGDINLDGRVDGADYVIWANFFRQPGTLSEGDFNRDGIVDGADYLVWANNYEGSATSAAIPLAVPEPSSLILLLTAAVCGEWTVRRSRGRK